MPDADPIYCRFKGGPCTKEDCHPGKQPGKPETSLPRCEHSLTTILDENLNSSMEEGDREQLEKRFELEELALDIPNKKMVEVFDATLEAIRDHRKALADWANY